MPNPRLTGISSITGKTVYIRHATEADLIAVQEHLKEGGKHDQKLTAAEVVVAVEEDRIIGFGLLEKPGPEDAGCIMVSEDGRRRGIGASIVRHLMAYAPVKTVYAATGRPDYFKGAGFVVAKKGVRKDGSDGGGLCRFPGKHAWRLREYTRI